MTRNEALNLAAELFKTVASASLYNSSEATATLNLARAEAAKGLVMLAKELREG